MHPAARLGGRSMHTPRRCETCASVNCSQRIPRVASVRPRRPQVSSSTIPPRHQGTVAAGSVVASWLLDLTAVSPMEDPTQRYRSSRAGVSLGEGRWTTKAESGEDVPHASSHHGVLRGFQLSRVSRFCQQIAVCHAVPVRRTLGEVSRAAGSGMRSSQ
jgi:hypothetical protein